MCYGYFKFSWPLCKPHQQVCRVKLRQNHAPPLRLCPSKRSSGRLSPRIFRHVIKPMVANLHRFGILHQYVTSASRHCESATTHLWNVIARRRRTSWGGAGEARSFTYVRPSALAHPIITAQNTVWLRYHTRLHFNFGTATSSADKNAVIYVVYPCIGLHNRETNPLPQRCSNGSCQCHVTRSVSLFIPTNEWIIHHELKISYKFRFSS